MSIFREYLGGRLYGTVQNMNRGWDSRGGAKGPLWRRGRARLWLRLTRAQRADRAPAWSFGISWSFGGRACRASLTIGDWGDDTDIGLSFAVPGVSLHFDVEGVLPSHWRPKEGRDLGFFVGDGAIFVKLWCALDEWHSDRSFWDVGSSKRQPVLRVANWLLGKMKHTERPITTARATVTLPEGEYPVLIQFAAHTWKRPRWHAHTVVRANVQVLAESGIPIPGKGENDYDQNEDAIYSLSTHAATVETALAALYASVERDRQRYGGLEWLPVKAGEL